jgi:hypothetical protein
MADPDIQDERIAVLEAQVASLQRTVATLSDVLVRTGVIAEGDHRTIALAARRPREDFAAEAKDSAENDGPAAIVGSPYRGGAPAAGAGCTVCGKRLDADDPELSLAARGRVCTMCFTRGG